MSAGSGAASCLGGLVIALGAGALYSFFLPREEPFTVGDGMLGGAAAAAIAYGVGWAAALCARVVLVSVIYLGLLTGQALAAR